MNFKKHSFYFPHYLFCIFSLVSLMRGVTIPEAIALFAIGALSCYRSYLSSIAKPDLTKQFAEEIISIKNELNALKTEVGQINFSTRRIQNEKVRF